MSEVGAYQLVIEDDEGHRSVVPIDLGEVSIGRFESNTIRLDERNVSRHHARLAKDDTSVWAEDLDSYNGLFLNGSRVKGRSEIHHGDLIRIGDFHLELRGDGLAQREEETTQRTLAHERETTQPDLGYSDSTAPMRSVRPPPIPGGAALAAPPTPPAGPESAPHEPTVRIRLEQDEDDADEDPVSAIAGERAKLVCVSTQFGGQEFDVARTEVVLGRTDENDIGLDHRSVSRHHAKVVVSDSRFTLVDMQSANGTLVNGEEYAQTELRHGDLIELGHVKLRFVSPGRTYNLTAEELAAVRRRGDREEETGESTDPAIRIKSFRGTLVAAGIATVVVGTLAVAVFSSRSGELVEWVDSDKIIADPPAGQAPHPPGANTAGPDLLGRAEKDLLEHNWKQAAALAEAKLAFDPNHVRAQQIAKQASKEVAAQAAYDTAQAASAEGKWEAAWNALGEVPQDSLYHEQALSLRPHVRGGLITERVGQASQALEQEEWDRAAEYADEISSLDPEHVEVRNIRSAIAEGQKRRGTPSKTRAKQKARPKPKPKPKEPPPPTQKVDAKEAYVEGVLAVKEGNLTAAIDAFQRCVQQDKRYAPCYRGLGIAHAHQGNGPKAARYYRQYLKVKPGAADADKVKKLLEQYESRE